MTKTSTKEKTVDDAIPGETGTALTGVNPSMVAIDEAAMLDMMAADQKHAQVFSADQMIIPRLLLLQDLSPQVKEQKAEYIEGARPGMFCLPLVKGLVRSVDFIPARFSVSYLAWRPRNQGGGLVSSDLTLGDLEDNFTQSGPGQWIGSMAPRSGEAPVSVEVNETPEWVGLSRASAWGWMPCVMSFPGTKAKVARMMNTTISLTKVEGKSGKFTPPSFYHMFRFTSVFEERDAGDFWTPVVDRAGWVADTEALADARQLAISASKGEVVADDGAGA